MKKQITCDALRTWVGLNEVMRTASEETCRHLLRVEKLGRRRQQFLRRIYSRLNRVRADRERAELQG
jgi:hypothetical protein